MLSASSPFSFILFGASGHLATLKIYPALYVLALKGRFPKDFAIVGYARTGMDDESFRTLVAESIRADLPEVNDTKLADFLSHVHYQRGQYDCETDFKALEKRLEELETGWTGGVRLAYLSIPPVVFNAVLRNICAAGIHRKNGEFRCIVEKPVGHDLKSFEEVRATLLDCFQEKEIYLLDHYLGKEAVRNIYSLRFANPIFEHLLSNALIHHVEIVADEADGLEKRAGYFEGVGTLRDFVQSHLLQMAALLTMRIHDDAPFTAARLDALDQLYLPPTKTLDDVILQGQYAAGEVNSMPVPGYRQEPDMSPASRTNTFIALKLQSKVAEWQGIPFYLRSGKRLAKKETRVSIEFRSPRDIGTGTHPNRLDIILQGEAGMRMHLQTKLGGSEHAFRPLILEDPLICVGDCLPEHALLLLEALHGVREWFLTFEEVRTAWQTIDPLQAHLDKPDTPLALYPAGGGLPKEAADWIAKDGNQWF